jgi:hypothetical protein
MDLVYPPGGQALTLEPEVVDDLLGTCWVPLSALRDALPGQVRMVRQDGLSEI